MRFSITVCTFLILFITCTTTPSSDPTPLQLQDVVYGGCAGLFNMPESYAPDRVDKSLYPDPDTLMVEWDDSLEIFLGLNYICCAPFAADHEIRQDTLVLAVRDTCLVICYCDCMCYYTFTWKFTGWEEDVSNLRVELFDPRVGTVEVLYREQLKVP